MPPLRLAEMLLAATEEAGANDPKTYKQAMKRPNAELWHDACKAEIDSLVENKVFLVVDRLGNKQVSTSKWVFKKKTGIDGKVEKYKARIVARGFMQEEGVDRDVLTYSTAREYPDDVGSCSSQWVAHGADGRHHRLPVR